MIIQIGTEVDESRILWKHKESDDWKRADIDELIRAFESIVRCRDCKYGEERIEDYRCGMLDEDWDIRFSPMHFCSYGRRREDGEA